MLKKLHGGPNIHGPPMPRERGREKPAYTSVAPKKSSYKPETTAGYKLSYGALAPRISKNEGSKPVAMPKQNESPYPELPECPYCHQPMTVACAEWEQWFYCDDCQNNTRSIKGITKAKYKAWYGQWRIARREAGDWRDLGHDYPEQEARSAKIHESRYVPAVLHEHYTDCWKWTVYGKWSLQALPNRSMRQWHQFHVSYPTMTFQEYMYFRRVLGRQMEACI